MQYANAPLFSHKRRQKSILPPFVLVIQLMATVAAIQTHKLKFLLNISIIRNVQRILLASSDHKNTAARKIPLYHIRFLWKSNTDFL